ncbi:MAG TPA: glycosyltransferase family 4 protein [Candidatus Paceibacterota bacterium]|nr:glycosyltransferase family 4 protein [Candidatus Paceibacterota bacterium]
MKVLFITQFSKIGGTSRIHALQFLPFLKQAGFDCREIHIYPDSFFKIQMGVTPTIPLRKNINLVFYLGIGLFKKIGLTLRAQACDLIFIQRETFPKSLYWLLQKINPHIVYQIEDPIYEVNPYREGSFFHRLILRYQAALCKNMMKGAAAVIVENKDLAQEAQKYNKKIYTITAPLDSDYWKPGPERTGDTITLGWMGSPSTTPFLKTVESVLSAIGRKYPNVQLKIVGASSDFFVPDIKLIKKDWSLEQELTDMQSFDIGLMPMIIAPFTKGHLGGKIIFYMLAGIPFVATDCEINRTVITDGVQGFLVSSHEEWIQRLILLIKDEALRQKLGANGRQYANEHFSLQKQIPIMIKALLSAANINTSKSDTEFFF